MARPKTLMTEEDYKKLWDTECQTFQGSDSNLFCLLDHIGQAFTPLFFFNPDEPEKGKTPAYLKDGFTLKEAEGIRAAVKNVLTDYDPQMPSGKPYPTRKEFRDAFVQAYNSFSDDPEQKQAQGYRGYIEAAFKLLDIEPVEDRSKAKPQKGRSR